MKRLNSLILTALVLFGSGFALKASPAIADTVNSAVSTKATVKAEEDIAKPEILAQLKLTAEQKKNIIAISTETYKKVSLNLTPDQRKKLETGLKAKQGFMPALKTLNLSVDQQKKIGALLVDHRKQVIGVLTPEQKKKLETLTAAKK